MKHEIATGHCRVPAVVARQIGNSEAQPIAACAGGQDRGADGRLL